jgi:hypothetical protein
MEFEIERLKRRAKELREELSLLSERAPYQCVNPSERERLGAKLAHVEQRLFRLRQLSLFKGA